MSAWKYTASPEAVAEMLSGDGHFVPGPELLSDLTPQQVTMLPPGARYTIGQIVRHLHFYQGWELAAARGEPWPSPAHLEDTFTPVTPDEWPALVDAFLANLLRCRALALNTLASGQESRTNPGSTVAYDLLGTALHNAYHFGQIVTLRQLLGLWPPRSGEPYDF